MDRIRQLIREGKSDAVIDVDGSYLYKKFKQLTDIGALVKPPSPPPPPPCGWKTITEENHAAITSIPPSALPCHAMQRARPMAWA